jgi:protein O-GlcNAc transferase
MSSAERTLQDALSAFNLQRHADAERLFKKVLKSHPTHVGALNLLTVVLMRMQRFAEAEPFIARAVKLSQSSDVSFYNYGLILKNLRKPQPALEQFSNALRLNPKVSETWNNRGTTYNDLQQYEKAVADFDQAILLSPSYADAVANKGKSLRELKRHDEALAAYDKAISLKPNLAEAWLGRGEVLIDLRRSDEALAAYDRALSLKPDLAEAWLSRGNVLADLSRYDEAFAAYDQVLSLKPGLAEAWLGRGNALADLHRYDGAFGAYDKAVSLKPELAEAWLGRGNALVDLKRYDEAVPAYDKAYALKPDLTGVEGARMHCRMHLCDWRDFETERDRLVQSVRSGKANSSPFPFLAIPSSAEDQLDCARLWVKNRYPASNERHGQRGRYAHDRIRLAYLSTDFRQHPTSYLAAGLFEHHDRSRFEITAISLERGNDSGLRGRLQAAFERFIDVDAHSDDQIAGLIASLEIDILIDLNGHTKGARTKVLARRPAPIQVNYLGYPGTMGADYIDYMIADRRVVPETHEAFYSEKMVLLPNTYQVNDADRGVVGKALDKTLERSELGLPPSGFVFCCFNNGFKLTPDVFDGWMRILKQVDGSVLWLFEDIPTVAINLRKEAVARGVSPERLVFAKRVSQADHMARHGAADLFLDTLPYNAHTTASDALWAGVPVLTRSGETFAGRVAASLLTAIRLPELIAATPEQFESMAIELARRPEALAAIKAKLAQHRSTQPLFDTKSYTRHIESAYAMMVERHQKGLPPDHIQIPQSGEQVPA